MDMPAPVDPSRCPLCGEENACGMAQGAGTCWCFTTPIPPEVIERVPVDARNRACVCERCASAPPVRGPAIDPRTNG